MLKIWCVIILPFGSVFALHSYVRGIDAVLGGTLISDLSISPTDLGLVTSAYLFTYALMQIPAGIMLDAWGYARTQSLLLLLAGLGALIFSQGQDVATLSLGRAVMGMGMAASLSAGIKAVADNVRSERMTACNGIIIALGGIGALLATAPSAALFTHVDWRSVFLLIAIAMALLAVVMSWTDRRTPKAGSAAEPADQPGSGVWAGLGEVLMSSFFWRATALISVSYGGFAAVQGLWLAPWLSVVGGIAPGRVDITLLVVAAAMTAGTLSFGLVRSLGRVTGLGLPAMVALGTLLHMATQGMIIGQVFTGSLVFWVAFGLLAPITMMIYSMLAEHFGPARSGRAISAANFFICLAAVAIQNLAGLVVDIWPHGPAGNAIAVYRTGAALFLALEAVAFLLYLPLCKRPRVTAAQE